MAQDVSRIGEIVGPARAFHLMRATLPTSRPKRLAGAPHAMVVWVQNDGVRLHHDSGRIDLSEGDVLFLRPGEPHALQGRGAAPMVVSVALWSEILVRLGDRHPELAGRLFWSNAPEPRQAHLDSRALAALNQAALRLERARQTALEAESFLLPLCAQLLDREVALPDGAPVWLAVALSAAKEPRVFREGAAGFARIAGRAHPHVSRTMRRFTGQTPSDYINAQRMAFAARRLAGSSDPLSEIAADCGIPNLSHFHKLFRSHHGLTPAQYRRSFQRALVRPDP